MEKIVKEFKRFYKLKINDNELIVGWLEDKGRKSEWSMEGIYAADFKIQAKQFGADAGILKIEIG